MKITREWAMPSPDTFSIPPIAALLERWLTGKQRIIDPFARNSKVAHFTNDLNPETTAEYHMGAVEFLEFEASRGLRADAILIDPPYSPRQISEVYKQIGRACGTADTQNAKLYKAVKEAANRLADNGTVVICCGWNSVGMGKAKYEFQEILLVAHGGAHNDTIVTVEIKLQSELI